MRFSTLISLAAASTALAAPHQHEAQYNPAISTLQLLSGQLGVLVQDATIFNGGKEGFDRMVAEAQSAMVTLNRATSEVLQGPAYSIFTSPTVLPATTKLDTQVHALADILEQRKGLIDSMGQTQRVAAIIELQYVGVSQLVNAFALKIPSGYWYIASPIISEIPRRIGRTMNIYKGLAPTSPIPAVSLSTFTGQ